MTIKEAAKANKRKSTTSGRFHSGSTSKSSADESNKAVTVRGKRLALDEYSAYTRTSRAERAAARASAAAAQKARRWALEADVSRNNPPGFQ